MVKPVDGEETVKLPRRVGHQQPARIAVRVDIDVVSGQVLRERPPVCFRGHHKNPVAGAEAFREVLSDGGGKLAISPVKPDRVVRRG